MTILTRLDQWKQSGVLSPEQHAVLADLSQGKPFSVFLELNILLFAGILVFIAGLGLTVTTFSQQLGDVLLLSILTAALAASLYYTFSRAPAWSRAEIPPPSLVFDYVLYFGCLLWSLELSYIETQFHLLSGQWDLYLLSTAAFFFSLAYRFDNRFVLSLALSALAGWFGLTISRWPSHQDESYRYYAILYSLLISIAGANLARHNLKPHFLGAYLNLAANVLFCALVSGTFNRDGSLPWLLGLILACGASLAWGLKNREFPFVAYAALYGYIGISAVLVRGMTGDTVIFGYFTVTGTAMLITIVAIARRFGRQP
ncbi:MAG: DUF2157 domain-containing protein [Bryobacterales bacterium]|nr:DUF2157 domain-containing protein [Bryobacterales bacterium]